MKAGNAGCLSVHENVGRYFYRAKFWEEKTMRILTQEEEKWVEAILKKITDKMVPVTERNRDRIPYTTVDGRFDDKSESEITWWTNGFWAARCGSSLISPAMRCSDRRPSELRRSWTGT